MRLLAALCAAVAFAPAAAAASPTGLYGVVSRSPTRPVCEAGVACSSPVRDATLVFSRGGRDVARARTGKHGQYRVALPAGSYVVRVQARLYAKRLAPPRVSVVRGSLTRVDFTIDTGIRAAGIAPAVRG